MGLGKGPEHLDAQKSLVDGVRRRRNIDEKRSSLPDQFSDGIAFVERFGPEILVVPDVFADGDTEFLFLK